MNDKLEPGLYIVATPIGNLSDLSPPTCWRAPT
jgi:16S rRNA C1402 (ribose-2'-O) methylase RsmI